MEAFRVLVLCGSILFGVVAAAAKDGQVILDNQPPELVRRLMEKKVVILKDVSPGGRASDEFFLAFVIFESSAQRAYELLADTPRHIEFRPEVRGMKTVDRVDEGHVDEHRLRVIFLNFVYWVRYYMDPALRQMRWELDPRYPSDLALATGFWELYELEPDRSLGRFGATVDIGPALPTFLQSWVTRKNLPRTIDRARRWVDSDGTYRP